MKSVMLYRVAAPFWMTDASIQPNGDLTITSGDTANEWVLTVAAEHKRMALQALRQQAASAPPESADPDDALLAVLADRFAEGENPYEAIKEFLRGIDCPSHATAWIAAGGPDREAH